MAIAALVSALESLISCMTAARRSECVSWIITCKCFEIACPSLDGIPEHNAKQSSRQKYWCRGREQRKRLRISSQLNWQRPKHSSQTCNCACLCTLYPILVPERATHSRSGPWIARRNMEGKQGGIDLRGRLSGTITLWHSRIPTHETG